MFALRRDFPDLTFSINGGIGGPAEAAAILDSRLGTQHGVEGVMIGRAAYNYPWQVYVAVVTRYPPRPAAIGVPRLTDSQRCGSATQLRC